MIGRWRLLALGLFLAVALLAGGAARAQTPAPLDDEVHAIAKQMNCPTCAGRNLADCPTQVCQDWKQEIRSQLQSGKSSREVLQYFQDRFGPTVLQEPPREGAVLVLWLLPVLAVVGLALAGLWVVRRASVRRAPAGEAAEPPAAVPGDPYVSDLEAQVKEKQ